MNPGKFGQYIGNWGENVRLSFSGLESGGSTDVTSPYEGKYNRKKVITSEKGGSGPKRGFNPKCDTRGKKRQYEWSTL